jgi:hypothetical protein
MSSVVDQNSWRRKHDDPGAPAIVPLPQSRFYPASRNDLIEIITAAQGMPDPKPEVKACGSHWAFSGAAMTQGFIVETNDPDETNNPRLDPPQPLFEVIPGCMTPEAIQWFYDQNMAAFVSFGRSCCSRCNHCRTRGRRRSSSHGAQCFGQNGPDDC